MERLVDFMETYLGYPREAWWFSVDFEAGMDEARLPYDPIAIRRRWNYVVEEEEERVH